MVTAEVQEAKRTTPVHIILTRIPLAKVKHVTKLSVPGVGWYTAYTLDYKGR